MALQVMSVDALAEAALPDLTDSKMSKILRGFVLCPFISYKGEPLLRNT
ncbi:hypothetical protein M0804_006497 [Polistes exclamans]|nr:hypothetical protein M0804_006497 [Polistes exclamans]